MGKHGDCHCFPDIFVGKFIVDDIKRQGSLFIFFGVLQIGVDWLVFVALSAWGFGVSVSNLTGRISGAVLGFFLNGKFTFPRQDGKAFTGMVAARFLLGWGGTAAISTLAVKVVADHATLGHAWLLKPMIDIVIAFLGFLLSKYWIFK